MLLLETMGIFDYFEVSMGWLKRIGLKVMKELIVGGDKDSFLEIVLVDDWGIGSRIRSFS